MIAGAASGQWQLSAGGTQFWLANTSAYTDTGISLKFNWDRAFEPGVLGGINASALKLEAQSCKLAPSIGQTRQTFPLSTALNGAYSFARMELLCKAPSTQGQETQAVLGSGSDKAQSGARPGGDKKRLDLLLRHERLVATPWSPFKQIQSGQFSAWARLAKSADAKIYSELLGELKTSTHRADWGVGFWVPLERSWSAGLNLEATSQRSNNTLFNLKNSGIYAGIRWSEN